MRVNVDFDGDKDEGVDGEILKRCVSCLIALVCKVSGLHLLQDIGRDDRCKRHQHREIFGRIVGLRRFVLQEEPV